MEKEKTITNKLFDKNPVDMAFFLQKINGGKLEHYMQFFLFKWITEGKIRVIALENDLLIKKRHTTVFFLENGMYEGETIENLLWNILLENTDEENKITDQQMKNLVKTNAMFFIPLGNKLTMDSQDYLIKNGYLNEKEQSLFHFKWKKSQTNTAQGNQLYDQLLKQFRYLEEAIGHNLRTQKEIDFSEEYLSWISLFGLADKFNKQIYKISTQQPSEVKQISRLIGSYTNLAAFIDAFSIGFSYAKNSVGPKKSCC
ncbi:hypothetical protein [Tetragenococcus muriaticus]|uniref:hypothetical protein n=1 Tax=Tetragenococcus muriaticus TaxID=64642 RepID=UPI0004089AE6|nr:hypothetical protein [Tetragenococcus muriaticus]